MPWTSTTFQWLLAGLDAGGWLAERGGRRVGLDPVTLEHAARRATGLDDLGDPGYREALGRLCSELDGAAGLRTAGRLVARAHIVRALSNRLLMVEARERVPSHFETPIVPPLMIVGLPRTGTTFLHRLMCSDPEALWLPTWALQRPLPPLHGADRRRLQTKATIAVMRHAAPEVDTKHELAADAPEECMMLLDATFASRTFPILFPVFDHARWLLERDAMADYAWWRDGLSLFQRQRPDARLVLKAPAHTAYLPALWHHVPQIRLVQTHRDPVVTVASLCSLFRTTHRMTARAVDARRLGREVLEMVARVAARCMAARDAHPEHTIVDVAYEELVADPVGTVLCIYEMHQRPITPALERALRSRVAAPSSGGHHAYALSEFGLCERDVRSRLAAYLDRFDVRMP